MRQLLSIPWIYSFFQYINGANNMRKTLTKSYIKSDSFLRILDIGCGTCDILEYLEFAEYTGIDFSNKYIKKNKKRFSKKKNVKFLSMDLNDFLAINSEKFDIILLLGVMHHLNDSELNQCLSNIQKALSPDGRIVTLDGVYEDNLTWFEKLLLRGDRGAYIRTKEEWVQIFTSIFRDYTFSITKNLYYLPYNVIIL